jgi:hypothetical protein
MRLGIKLSYHQNWIDLKVVPMVGMAFISIRIADVKGVFTSPSFI